MTVRKFMSDIIVIAFRHPDAAQQVAAQFLLLQEKHALDLDDARIVVKDSAGRLHVKDVAGHPVATGALIGGLIGALLFIMSPVIGVLVGAAAGSVIGKAFNSDLVDGRFVDDVAQALKPDSSAVFLQVREADKAAVVNSLRQFRGTLIQTTVSPELEEEFKRALAPIKPRSTHR
jgi:uncharacterized membrane protein